MLRLKFSVAMATRGHLKNHFFALIFSIKIDFKVLQLLNGWIEIESNAFQHWLHITL
jgi:hypothetical protein